MMNGKVVHQENLLSSILYVLRDKQEVVDKDEDLRFFQFCLGWMSKTQTSQNFQDAWVLYELYKKYNNTDFLTIITPEGGYRSNPDLFYVEFGAADGNYMSNTHLLQSLGFKGILAEPNPIFWDDLNSCRGNENRLHPDKPIFRNHISHDCISDTTGEFVKLLCTEDPLHSTMEEFQYSDYNGATRENNVTSYWSKTSTLYDLLKKYNAPKNITYISMDTEGSELKILDKFFRENDIYNVKMWTIEHNFTKNREWIYDLMIQKGYIRKFTEFSRWDDFYIRVEN